MSLSQSFALYCLGFSTNYNVFRSFRTNVYKNKTFDIMVGECNIPRQPKNDCFVVDYLNHLRVEIIIYFL